MSDHALMVILQSLQISKRNSLAFANPNLLPHYSNNSSFAYTPKLVIVFAQQHQSAQRVQHRLKRIHPEPDFGQPLAGFYLQNLGDHSLLHEVN
jgi:hypothetical protein